MNTFLTSESTTRGQPDKLCDQIADAVLDAALAKDPRACAACAATVTARQIHVFGELSPALLPDCTALVRRVLRAAGYTAPVGAFDPSTCPVITDFHPPSPDLAPLLARRENADCGAGSQGMVTGYATAETPEGLPLPLVLAHALARRLDEVRASQKIAPLLPDGKAQVTVAYENGKPKRIASVVVCAQHEAAASIEELRTVVAEKVIAPILPAEWTDNATEIYVNPAGRFGAGGPAQCSGLSGRKTDCDAYGGCVSAPALSGKDGLKSDRSGSYLARYLAKNVVAAGLAGRCRVRLAYALGFSEALSVSVDTLGTGVVADEKLSQWIRTRVDLRPAVIAERFSLQTPGFEPLACYGHFGRNASRMPWEQTDLVLQLLQQKEMLTR